MQVLLALVHNIRATAKYITDAVFLSGSRTSCLRDLAELLMSIRLSYVI